MAILLALELFGIAASALAAEDTRSAREHFTRGFALARDGSAAAACVEFEHAYAASPNPSVLYNLGQAYAADGRSGEAVDTLERFLKESGSSIDEARARQAEALIAYHKQRVGKLTLDVMPTEATVLIDARTTGSGSVAVSLNVGRHDIIVSAPGFESASLTLEMTAGASHRLELRLTPLIAPAQLALSCPIEDVQVVVDHTARGRTPSFTGLSLPSGPHRIRFERAGYVADEHTVELLPGQALTVSCRLRIDPNDATHGRLRVTHPSDTRVFLDDVPFRGSLVPLGTHRLQVSGAGYTSETRRIVLGPTQAASITLVPARDPRALLDERERTRQALRVSSYVLGGLGVATAVAAAAIYVDNDARYSSWQAKSQDSVRSLPTDPDAPSSLDSLLAEENAIRRRDSWALGMAVFSCAALAASTVLFLSSREPEQRLIVTAGAQPSLRYEYAF